MGRVRSWVVVAALLSAAGACNNANKVGPTAGPSLSLPPTTDAPYELADDQDLDMVRARYEALAPDDPARAGLRRELADEYAQRIEQDLADPRTRAEAHVHLQNLVSLWRAPELDGDEEAAAALARYRPQVEALRSSFARSGGDGEVTLALITLIAMDSDGAAEHEAELDEIFAFTDELAVSRWGPGAERSRSTEILEAAALALPTRFAVDRLVSMYVARQRALQDRLDREGASVQLVRAHGEGVLRTVWSIVRISARAERLQEAPAAIGEIRGIGSDADVARHLDAALARDAEPVAWMILAADMRAGGDERADSLAALRILEEGLRHAPDAPELHAAAGETARELENLPLAIAAYERAAELDPADRDLAENLAELYEARIGELVFNDRPNAASERLAELERFHASSAERWPDEPLEPDLASARAAMGRGLVSLGELDDAMGYLRRSLTLRHSYRALESLGTVALKQDRHAEAVRYLEQALELPEETPDELFFRARVLRLLGEAHANAGRSERARGYFRAALRSWQDILSRFGRGLRPRFRAEALVESGQLHWELGDQGKATAALESAIDTDPDGASTHATVVAFFITHDRYERALDAYHRALGSYDIGNYFKVYMSLWVLAEARRTGLEPDPLALDYLSARDGRLWYDDLARYATGRLELDDIEGRATTRARRAELLYYAAVLSDEAHDPGQVRALLEQVVDTDMVLFFEYDMAKHWLAEGFTPAAAASR